MGAFFGILMSVLAISVAVLLVIFVMVPAFKGVSWFIRHIFQFIFGMIYEVLRAIGGLVTSIVLLPLILLNVVIGRWSAASHYGRTFQDELKTIGRCCYRFAVGRPARLLLLTPLVEGIEKRVPEAVAHAPGADKPSKRTLGQFEGYKIVGSLRSGGSGGRLYIAEPDETKRAVFARRGIGNVDQVVIKAFSLADGSSLPQIVRESKSLDAARRLGLILEHELTDKRFYYVMRYVPGDTLSIVTSRLHDRAGMEGLRADTLQEALSYASDLVRTLNTYHEGGLWHKDVKPDNIIVSHGAAHLVDFGLVTPLRSAMTLTTHGTEYFRDPEMVRMALKGVKVAEVNGAKFDIYAAGAVIYSIIENGFPAHGGLSQITKKCPEGLRWIIRRAMADYEARYASSRDMLADLQHIMASSDPFAIRPADLPSMRGGPSHDMEDAVRAAHEEAQAVGAAAAARVAQGPVAQPAGFDPAPAGARHTPRPDPSPAGGQGRPRIRVTDWWKGGFVVNDGPEGAQPGNVPPQRGAPVPPHDRRPAHEQVERARARAQARRSRAYERMNRAPRRPKPDVRVIGVAIGTGPRRPRTARYDSRPNGGVILAALFLIAAVAGIFLLTMNAGSRSRSGNRIVINGADRTVVTKFDFDDIKQVMREAGERFREGGQHSEALRDSMLALQGAVSDWTTGAPFTPPADARPQSINEKINKAFKGRTYSGPVPPTPPPAPGEPAQASVASAPALPSAPDAPSMATAPGGTWLVINDLTGSPQEVKDEVSAGLDRLRAAGAEILGADNSEVVDIIASARKAIGATARVTDDAVERIKTWLADEGEAFTGLIWFARDDGPDTAFALAVVGQEGLNAAPVGTLLRAGAARRAQ
ncbi:MAG: serine/threonine protein kinase [Phycisphaerales bacterium]